MLAPETKKVRRLRLQREAYERMKQKDPEKLSRMRREKRERRKQKDPEKFRRMQREWYERRKQKDPENFLRLRRESQEQMRQKDPEKFRRMQREWYERRKQKDPEKFRRMQRKYKLKRYYRLTEEQYQVLLQAQNYICAICGIEEWECMGNGRKLHVDHCHETKRNRGLLCQKCNTGIGQFNHDIKRLQLAIDYLIKYDTKEPPKK